MYMMKSNQIISGGKYEVAIHLAMQEYAEENVINRYLQACIEDAIHAGVDCNKAKTIELENILFYAKRFNEDVQRRVKALFISSKARA